MRPEVFNRFEKKFILDEEVYHTFIGCLNEHGSSELYHISNIYYDTQDDLLIRKSLSKPNYKEKVRLRAYGTPSLDDFVYLEIKKKVKGLVNKRRTKMKLAEAYAFAETGYANETMPYHNRQVLNELEVLFKRYHLIPSTVISYDRIAYAIGDFRVTFDMGIKTRRTDLLLESGCYGRSLIEPGIWLMEVKTSDALPIWFVHLLTMNHLVPTGFSKYGKAFLTRNAYEEMRRLKGEKATCLKPYLAPQQVGL
ncbi:MAG TPA: molecular chaperone [Clostridiales bacterium UBA8960]|nr:molecular chaperone [Clostridiales bacterium UBA8960]